jgi:hypothetical protein
MSCHASVSGFVLNCYREGRETRLTASVPKGEDSRPTETNASSTKHTHTRQALDTSTQISHGGRPTGNRGQPQTTAAEGQEKPRNGDRPDEQVRAYKPDRSRDALPRHSSAAQGDAELPDRS